MINATINQFLTKQLPNLKIAVIGDVMVDRYVFGDVSRISPEAPVPVNRVAKMKEVLGGAGNVAILVLLLVMMTMVVYYNNC